MSRQKTTRAKEITSQQQDAARWRAFIDNAVLGSYATRQRIVALLREIIELLEREGGES